MSDSERLLELIEEGIVAHGGDLGGWTRRGDDLLQLFDGRVTLRADLREAGPPAAEEKVHAHVFTTLHEHDDEVLDACVVGLGENRDAAHGAQRGRSGFSPILSLMTVQSTVGEKPECPLCACVDRIALRQELFQSFFELGRGAFFSSKKHPSSGPRILSSTGSLNP